MTAELSKAGVEDAAFDAGCLLLEVLNAPGRVLTPELLSRTLLQDEEARLNALCARRSAGEPLQYLLGEWEFYGLPIQVGKGVLIPRPDTETLVEAALMALRGKVNPQIADLCSGSGCVAIALKKSLPGATVFAVEASDQAMPYLRQNAAQNAAKLTILQGDVLLKSTAARFAALDCIVCNPPYLTAADLSHLQREVAFEPTLALAGGEDGLRFYRSMPALWWDALASGGTLAFEIGAGQEEDVLGFLRAAGYEHTGLTPDLAGIIRVVTGRKPKR